MMNLYMVLLGSNLPNRFIEQHDIFFGLAKSIADLKESMQQFWPEAGAKLHIDSYRKVTSVNGYSIQVKPKIADYSDENGLHLYFLNLGGYKAMDMEEYHYKQLVVSHSMADAIESVKKDIFWKRHNQSHVDNRFGIDVDDAYLVSEMLSPETRENYTIHIQKAKEILTEDELIIGYLKLSSLK